MYDLRDGKNQQTISKKHITPVRRLNTIRMEMKVPQTSRRLCLWAYKFVRTPPHFAYVRRIIRITYKMNCGASRHYTFSHVHRRCVALSAVLYILKEGYTSRISTQSSIMRFAFVLCAAYQLRLIIMMVILYSQMEYVVDAEWSGSRYTKCAPNISIIIGIRVRTIFTYTQKTQCVEKFLAPTYL